MFRGVSDRKFSLSSCFEDVNVRWIVVVEVHSDVEAILSDQSGHGDSVTFPPLYRLLNSQFLILNSSGGWGLLVRVSTKHALQLLKQLQNLCFATAKPIEQLPHSGKMDVLSLIS